MSKEIEDHRNFNQSGNEPFSSIMDKHVSRRGMMRGGLGLAAMSVMGFGAANALAAPDARTGMRGTGAPGKKPLTLAFESIRGARLDSVVVPEGYTAQVLIPWGAGLTSDVPEWHDGLEMTPEIQANAIGMHHDGMYHFPLNNGSGSREFLLAINHEYIDQGALWAPKGGPTNGRSGKRPADEARTEINAHGVAVVHVKKQADGRWTHVVDSPYNRRITNASEMEIGGPLAGSDYVKTKFSPDGLLARGTSNNCGNGYTPWGTYLACEENWPGYFVRNADRQLDDERLGVSRGRGRYGWETAAGDASEQNDEFARFNTDPFAADATGDYRNEARTYGYQVEVDPYDGSRRAVKRTAMGRFRHEGCWVGKLEPGKPVVFYSGHDARNEYIYKYVSKATWSPADANRPGANFDRLAIGAKYLDEGTLYVARFDVDGSGEWLPLTPQAVTTDGRRLHEALGLAADDQAGIIIHTCDAADLMGATPMDRPEWGAVDPTSGDVYMTLTNNSQRTAEDTAPTFTNGGSNREELGVGYGTAPTNGPNPRPSNGAGQVIRWRDGDDVTRLQWEVFVFGAAAADTDNLSGLTELNQFASPDGLWYDDRGNGDGILWIQTDNGYDGVADYTNDQVLAVVPGALEGGVVTPENQQHLKRFAVGPNGSEVTGIFATPDKTALFINIQHPGNWPASEDATEQTQGSVRPRASTVVIQRQDGGPIAV
ncbi:PhoX family phosphatase [Halomonas sp. SSL-5]|uniref:PhoX family protein n=1 Tax=Halomonas sp. SSL-5 TaxID=3065855 RepID=UPI00273A2AFB|nr:PhoX family phosphatase [Halomonas sp. SSL-5]MDY7117013.1 PhoX family phosphatase [Halomonas sp. SSL-5]